MSTPMNIPFPELRQTYTSLQFPWIILSGVCSGLGLRLFHSSRVLGFLLFTPAAYYFLSHFWLWASNASERVLWAFRFSRRVTPMRLQSLFASEPSRFCFHTRFFRQLGRIPRLAPVCIVEDRETHEMIAVFPAAWSAVHTCRRLGLQEIIHKGDAEQCASPNGGPATPSGNSRVTD